MTHSSPSAHEPAAARLCPTGFAPRALLLGFALLLFVPTAWAQQMPSSVEIGGQIRQRTQIDDRDFNADTSPDDFHELRTRLNAEFTPVERVEVFVQIQDTRNFGDGGSTLSPPDGTFDLHQGYFKVNSLFDAPLSLKVGRQKLVYGNQRLVGGVEWSNQARTFDAGVLAYETETASVDLFAARIPPRFENSSDPFTSSGEGSDNLVGLYSTWTLTPSQTLEVFATFDNDSRDVTGSDETRLTRFTPGVTLKGSVSQVSYTLEGIYQGGELAGNTIQASLLSAFAKYTFDASGSPSVGAGYTRLSGNDPTDDEEGTFQTLFATNHKFYGFMDYFLGTPAAGLQDAHLKLSASLSEKISVGANIHHFMEAEGGSGSTDTFGQEVDLTFSYQFADPVSVTVGASSFFPGDTLPSSGAPDVSGGNTDDTSYWGYVMTSVNF